MKFLHFTLIVLYATQAFGMQTQQNPKEIVKTKLNSGIKVPGGSYIFVCPESPYHGLYTLGKSEKSNGVATLHLTQQKGYFYNNTFNVLKTIGTPITIDGIGDVKKELTLTSKIIGLTAVGLGIGAGYYFRNSLPTFSTSVFTNFFKKISRI